MADWTENSPELHPDFLDRLRSILGNGGRVEAAGSRLVLEVPGHPPRVISHRPGEQVGSLRFVLVAEEAARELAEAAGGGG